MTQLECFKATVEHRTHGEFLFYAGFCPSIAQRLKQKYGLSEEDDLREHFGMFAPVHVGLEAEEGKDFSKYYRDVEIPEGAVFDSLGVLLLPGSMHHFKRKISPLRNARKLEDIESFPYPQAEGGEEGMALKAAQARRAGQVSFSSMTHMYEDAWQLRGYEDFLVDMKTNPEWCEYILDRLTERNIKKAEAAARAGVDYLHTGDDVAGQSSLMFHIGDWRSFIKARWAKVYSAARAIKPDIQIWYHSDGNIFPIIPELIEIGVTMLNPVQPECMDPAEVKRCFGDKIVIDGTLGTQTTMPFGTADDVRRVVRERIETLGADGALILSPTHVLEPEVPVENIEAFVDEGKASGRSS